MNIKRENIGESANVKATYSTPCMTVVAVHGEVVVQTSPPSPDNPVPFELESLTSNVNLLGE